LHLNGRECCVLFVRFHVTPLIVNNKKWGLRDYSDTPLPKIGLGIGETRQKVAGFEKIKSDSDICFSFHLPFLISK